MNKREYRLWRLKLRRERRERRLADREYRRKYGGTYDNSENITSQTLKYSSTQPQYLYDKASVVKTPQDGDFIHTTPYTKQVQEVHGKSFVGYRWRRDQGTIHTTGLGSLGAGGTGTGPGWYGGYTDTVSMRANLLAKAQAALNEKVLSDFPSWDFLTDAAEFKETVVSLGSLATSLKEVATGVLTRNPKRVLRGFGVNATQRKVRHVKRVIQDSYTLGNTGHQTFTAISNLWVSYRYGLMPIVYSIEDALKALCSPENDREYLSTAQVTLSDVVFVDAVTTSTANLAFSSVKTHIARTCSGSIRMKSYHRYTEGVKARLLANPFLSSISTLYEVIPYSFVLDWFYDIGGWLRGLQLGDIVAESWVNATERGHTTELRYFTDLVPRPFYKANFEYVPGLLHTGKNFYFRRWKGSLTAVPPTLDWGLDRWKRQLDTLALSWQRVRLLSNHPPYVR